MRAFTLCAASAALVSAQQKLALPTAFPADAYTPHGYLDNPYHSMILHRSGVVRSFPPLGFGWWNAAFMGSYGGGVSGRVNYLSLLAMAVRINGRLFAQPEDFLPPTPALASRYHTSRLTSYDWEHDSVRSSLRFFLPRENALVCLAEVENTGGRTAEVVLHATHITQLGEGPWWGSDGIASRYVPSRDATITSIWAYGDAFALGSPAQSAVHFCSETTAAWKAHLEGGDPVPVPAASLRGRGPMYATQSYRLTIPPHASASLLICLTRGPSAQAAEQELASASRDALPLGEALLTEDASFWSVCPRLEGEWPEAWRRGWVYDFETLRMNVRRPIGIFTHPWDAMQVHAPRAVLGESSLDMMTLRYALPALAQQVVEGVFADAPAANVPCVREDGSMNMVSADGSECGTAPMWGYPFHVIKAMVLATGDSAWVGRLYPHLAAYLRWWLEHRTDREGWLHCNNSWESGQDGSRRFLVAEGNEGAVADFVRTVDVEASMAEALGIMEFLCGVAGVPGDAAAWRRLAAQRVQRTRGMFVDGWFRDVDGRSNTPIILADYFDVMMLAPVACRVATPEQVQAVRPMFRYYREHQRRWLEWPPLLFTYAEAAWAAGERMVASEALADVADRVYARTDARTVRFAEPADPFAYRVPGVANEFWPMRDIPPGGENYGWGATLPMNILRAMIGFREQEGEAVPAFRIGPALPERLMHAGRQYRVVNLRYRDLTLDLSLTVRPNDAVVCEIAYRAPRPCTLVARGVDDGRPYARSPRGAQGQLSFDGRNGSEYVVRCE